MSGQKGTDFCFGHVLLKITISINLSELIKKLFSKQFIVHCVCHLSQPYDVF